MSIAKPRIKHLLYTVLGTVAFSIVFQGFILRQDNFFAVVGEVRYDRKEYTEQRADVVILEDGKVFNRLKCDDKGKFETKIFPNHTYTFKFSMPYHATSRVEVDTHVPKEIAQGNIAGIFTFNCDIFERLEGMNYALLNKPLLKFLYLADKNEFSNDKKYSDKIEFDLIAFRERLDEMKQRRKEVIKEKAKPSENEMAEKEEPKEEKRKPIVFEEEKKKPKVTKNVSGHRNIMDLLNDPKEEEEPEEDEVEEEDVAVEEVEEKAKEKVVAQKEQSPEEVEKQEEMFLLEEVDESEYLSINVIPKRVVIDQIEKAETTEIEKKPTIKKELVYQKMKRQQVVQLKRVEEEVKIREEITSFTARNYMLKERRLANKKIQNLRIRGLIKTIALAEIYFKREYYASHPINHNKIIPLVLNKSYSRGMIDTELTIVKYPGNKTEFRKETYPFNITYYFINGEEADSDAFCSGLTAMVADQNICEN